ncbi:hypothetical protein Ae505Ps2_6254 [Pseudonocardia sp. Ae505_Ps2]|nr:hypothetical protein Ae505Ps2_6254 [Pseudonocardia sp. Ae505_Ps2]
MPDALGEILGQVTDVPSGFFGAAEDSLDVDLRPEHHRVRRSREGVGVGRLVPGGQRLAGVRVDERLVVVVPAGEPVPAVDEFVVGGPPDLVVGRGGDRSEFGAGDGAADGGVEVGCSAFLGFDGAEVLHVPTHTAPRVLPEPVEQFREVDRIPRRPAVVVGVGVEGGAVAVDAAVGVEGEGEERGGPVLPAEDPAHGAVLHRAAWEVGCVLASAGGAAHGLGCRVERGEAAPDTESAEFGVDVLDDLADLSALGFGTCGETVGVGGVEVRAGGHQLFLRVGRVGRFHDGFVVEVPAFAALDHA